MGQGPGRPGIMLLAGLQAGLSAERPLAIAADDPLLRKYLLEKGLATEAEIKAIDKRVEEEVGTLLQN
eukprot:1160849-Pelagomonas_calceolata.AAC.2